MAAKHSSLKSQKHMEFTSPRASLTSKVANSQDRAGKLMLKFILSCSSWTLRSTTISDFVMGVRKAFSSCESSQSHNAAVSQHMSVCGSVITGRGTHKQNYRFTCICGQLASDCNWTYSHQDQESDNEDSCGNGDRCSCCGSLCEVSAREEAFTVPKLVNESSAIDSI